MRKSGGQSLSGEEKMINNTDRPTEGSDNNAKATAKNKFTAPKRTAWYLFRTALIFAVIVGLMTIAFFFAMDAANIYIIVTEGMTLRMDCTLGSRDYNEMYEYFIADFVDKDERVHNNAYDLYNIENYDYRLDIDKIDIWPFATTATMTVTERVPNITGEGTADAPSANVPAWEAGRYTVTCKKIDGRWFIEKVKLIKANPEEPPRATPDMSLLTPTPTPEHTEEPPVTDIPDAESSTVPDDNRD